MRPLSLALSLMLLAGAASAQNITLALPNLDFPPDEPEVSKDCTDPVTLDQAGCDAAE